MSGAVDAGYDKMTAAMHAVIAEVSGLNTVHQQMLAHTATVAATVESFHRAEQLGPHPFDFRAPTADEAAAAAAAAAAAQPEDLGTKS
mmetsp:Transcript_36060/g.94555  ORF Transcript_36060/g.94555 Transcript_36060/m.94555 type:complete len:88 (+) Transcript_36060:201-464(+)